MTLVLDHGSVEIVNVSHQESEGWSPFEPREAMDLAVVNAARVSYGKHSWALGDSDRGLIRRLLKDGHSTPFEHPSITWRVKAPIFVFREWHRHRTASISEVSARYTELPEEFYVPALEDFRTQVGKPADYQYEPLPPELAEQFQSELRAQNEAGFALYRTMLAGGVAREVARTHLPLGTYSEMQWTCNVHNLMRFLTLRSAPNAQREIRRYAEAMIDLWAEVMPVTAQAWALRAAF